MSLAAALTQAFVLVLLAATAVSLVQDNDTVHVSAGPFHLGVNVWVTTGTATVCALVMIFVQVWAGRLSASLAKAAEDECRRRLVGAYLDAPWALVAQRERGELQQVLTNNVSRVSRAVMYRAAWIFGAANLAILLGAALVLSPMVALLMIAAGSLLAVPLRPIKARTRRAASEHNEAEREFATFIAGIVEQSRETRVFNVGHVLGEQSGQLSARAAEGQRRMQFLVWTTPAVYLGAALLALILGTALFAAFGSSHLAAIGPMVLLLMRSLVYGQTALASMQYLVEAAPYLEELDDHLALYRDAHRRDGTVDSGTLQDLLLTDAGYTYPGAETASLASVSLSIKRGEAIGVVGPTGSGKTTFAEVVLRLRELTQGSYSVNGTDTARVSMAAWSRQVAYVPQHSIVFDGTIRDNIRYFRPWISDYDVEQAALDAQIDGEIRAMSDGYDTVVSGLSVGLSGGQRQRICIARALAGQPELLVMDEPTSGLDLHSERLFVETLERLKNEVTLVVIAHRLETIAICDRVIAIERGRVAAEGPPSIVLGKDGYFAPSDAAALPG